MNFKSSFIFTYKTVIQYFSTADRHLRQSVCSLRPSAVWAVCYGNAGTEGIYGGYWTNVGLSAGASIDRLGRSSTI